MSENLLLRIRQHDPEALAEFLAAHRQKLMSYIDRELGTALRRKVEPEDVFQETSAEALRALPTTDLGDREAFSWLCEIALRRIIDLHRHFFDAQKRNARLEVPLAAQFGSGSSRAGLIEKLVASITSPSEAFSLKYRKLRLDAALRQLSAIQREALRLRFDESLPTKQIAARVEKTDAAVRVILSRALRKLQDLLGQQDAPSG